MFRPQVNPMDDAVNKATDENLTSENWEYILDVCDKVSASPSGPQQTVASLIKRLAHRNANVQLYTLELANALSQNCGPPLHRELASKAFTDSLLRLVGDRTTHGQVKQKVLERMGTWTEEFKSNPELGIMAQAYQKLRAQQPGLLPPSKPTKTEISSEDRRKEEDELQMALALSIKDKGSSASGPGEESIRDDSEPRPAQPQAASQQGTTAATVSRVRALYDFTPSEPGELAFRKGDVIAVLESVYKDWWRGSLRGQSGIFPLNYVEKLQDPTKDELEQDAQMEAEVFGEIKNVEKLLALLSVRGEGGGRRGEREEEEISQLYQRTLSIRPKLIELIRKYSQKKDDFTQLNEKFIKARRDYEALLESSMSQPQYQHQYPIRNRLPSYPPQQNSAPYSNPAQAHITGYPPPGAALAQAYPSHAAFSQVGPPQQQSAPQDPQQFYSTTSGPPEASSQQGSFAPPYGPGSNSAAPFHFIPGGVQGGGQQEIRRKPSPQGPPGNATGEPFNPNSGFQGQIRPNSIHTLNSGNPQELATGAYESPVEKRQSYVAGQMGASHNNSSNYESYAAQPSQGERADTIDSPSNPHPSQSYGQADYTVGPSVPSGAPPPQSTGYPASVPHLPDAPSGPSQAYQAYQPYQAPGQRVTTSSAPAPSSNGAGGDPGDFYR